MTINEMMAEYKANINILATINLEYTKSLGKSHEFSSLSNTLVTALNQFEKFYYVVDNKMEYVNEILKFSKMAIDIFELKPQEVVNLNVFKKKKMYKRNYQKNKQKIDNVLEQMNIISRIIDRSVIIN
ncbi:MAG: hypothetical protein ACI35S_00020 [Anaeroplasma sp.]